MFLALTPGTSLAFQRKMAVNGTLLASGMLLAALGTSLPAFRIAAGVLLFLLAIDMVFAR